MRARVRDAIAVAILLVAAVAVRLVWHPLGPWVSLVIAFAAGLAAVAVYRVRSVLPPAEPPPAGPPPSQDAVQPPALLRQD